MKLIVDVPTMITSDPELIIEHKGKSLRWNVSNYDKKVFTSQNDITLHINRYWEQLDDIVLDRIFGLFQDIRFTMDEIFEPKSLIDTLSPKISNLLDIHHLDDLEHWIVWKSDIIISNDKFEDSYVVNDMKPGTRDKTYTRPDYIKLVALTLQLRLMIPIWGEFIYRTRSEIGTHFKEDFALKLLATSNTMESEAMYKLTTYVQANLKDDVPLSVFILNGISSEDYVSWMLGLVIIRRLCLGDITGSNPITNLVTLVFNYVSQKVNGAQNTQFGQMVKPKIFESSSSSDDHNTSRTEGYKIKQEISIGDISVIEYYCNNPSKMKWQLQDSIPDELLDVCLDNAYRLSNCELTRPQIIITQWVMSKIVSPRGIDHLTKKAVLNCFAVTQAWLWHNNHKQLACLQTAVPTDNSMLSLSGIDSRAKVTKQQIEILSKLYPFSVVKNKSQKTRPSNEAMNAIDLVASGFSERDWILNTPDYFNKEINVHNNRHSAPHDIKVLLAALIIDINNQKMNQPNITTGI